jgi:hypothetical protein
MERVIGIEPTTFSLGTGTSGQRTSEDMTGPEGASEVGSKGSVDLDKPGCDRNEDS